MFVYCRQALLAAKRPPPCFERLLVGPHEHLSLCVCSGIAFKGNIWGAEEASVTLHTNYQGTVWVCETLKHLIPPGGRIVNVTSRYMCVNLGQYFHAGSLHVALHLIVHVAVHVAFYMKTCVT